MKKLPFILGLIWLLIALFLGVLLYQGITQVGKNYFNISFNTKSLFNDEISKNDSSDIFKSFSYNAEKLNEVSIAVSSCSINYIGTSDSKIKIDLVGKWTDDIVPAISCENSSLEIKTKSKINNNFGSRKIIVSIPDNCISKNTVFKINHTSGSVRIQNIPAAKNITINGASGSSKIDNVTSDSINIDSASGSIKLDSCKISNVKINSASGSIKLAGAYDNFNIAAVSGSITVDNEKTLTKDSSIEAVSGSIKINIPEKSNFVLKCNTKSGSIYNGITGNSFRKSGTETVGNGGVKLNINTVSGSIKIN